MEDMNDSDDSDMDDINESDRDIQGKFRSDFVSGFDDDDDGIEEGKPDESVDNEILWAAENNDVEEMKKLIELDVNLIKTVDKDGYTPLHRAAYNNHLEVLELLLEKGADINAETLDGWTPLHSACHWNSALCAERLLSLGVDINRKSHGGITPLHLAASNNQATETLQTLLLHPAIDATLTDSSHETAHEIARRKTKSDRYFEVVEPCFNYI